MEISKYIEHVNLDEKATLKDIEKLCDEAIKYKFSSVKVLPYYVPLAVELLKNTNIEVDSMVGFNTGLSTTRTKEFEAIDSINEEANIITLVLNTSAIKNKDFSYIKEEIEEIRDSIDGKTLKAMFKMSNLTEKELIKLVNICNETFLNFIEMYVDDTINCDYIKKIMENKNEILEVQVTIDKIDINLVNKLVDMGVSLIGISDSVSIMKED